jgi:hypothetical protein
MAIRGQWGTSATSRNIMPAVARVVEPGSSNQASDLHGCAVADELNASFTLPHHLPTGRFMGAGA